MRPPRRVVRDDGRVYESMEAAGRDNSTTSWSVFRAAKEGRTAGGHTWVFVDPPERRDDVFTDDNDKFRVCERCRKWHRVLGDMGRCADGYSASAGDTCPRWS